MWGKQFQQFPHLSLTEDLMPNRYICNKVNNDVLENQNLVA
jgi:hypothetical protein